MCFHSMGDATPNRRRLEQRSRQKNSSRVNGGEGATAKCVTHRRRARHIGVIGCHRRREPEPSLRIYPRIKSCKVTQEIISIYKIETGVAARDRQRPEGYVTAMMMMILEVLFEKSNVNLLK